MSGNLTQKCISGKLRAKAQLEFRGLAKEQRRKLTSAFKSERQTDPKLDWQSWLSRHLPDVAGATADGIC